MPRTKIIKSKRNRDATKEEREEIKNERLREFDSMSEQMKQNMLSSHNEAIEEIIQKRKNHKLKLTPIRSMLFVDFINMAENAIIEMNKTDSSKLINVSNLAPMSSTLSAISNNSKRSKDDEGYLTEDNTKTLQLPAFPTSIRRTPGPLSSAKARIRRSRSASVLLYSAQLKQISVTSEHNSRSILRTPLLQKKLSTRPKAMSTDRRSSVKPKFSSNHSPVLCRWAKPGETIISLSGSPIVTPMAPDSVANINIPTRNGIFSLKPKRTGSLELGQKIADHICPETLVQIKQLHEHLNMILRLSDKN